MYHLEIPAGVDIIRRDIAESFMIAPVVVVLEYKLNILTAGQQGV